MSKLEIGKDRFRVATHIYIYIYIGICLVLGWQLILFVLSPPRPKAISTRRDINSERFCADFGVFKIGSETFILP